MSGCHVPISPFLQKKCLDGIADDEGFRAHKYKDTKGFDTIGFGFNLEKIDIPFSVATAWLNILIGQTEDMLIEALPVWHELTDGRKYVLINMAYQMGISGLFRFHDMIKALSNKDYAATSAAMKDSIWYKEHTSRASRLIKIMLSGEF